LGLSSSMTSMSLIGSGFWSSFFASSFSVFFSWSSSLIDSLLSIGSIETVGFDVVGCWFLVIGSMFVCG